MIDLARNHKLGFTIHNPVMLAAGTIAYGEAVPKGLDLARLGAVVIGPLLGSSRGGSPPPRVAHLNGGALLQTGLQSRGISQVLQRYGRLWPRLGCPIIAQIADDHPAGVARVVEKLAGVDGVSGLELLVPPDVSADGLGRLLRAVSARTDLPVWVKLPLASAVSLAPVAVANDAAGVVVGQAPVGAALPAVDPACGADQAATAHAMHGALLGPLAFAPMLAVLLAVAALQLPCALLACGGLHTAEQVRQALAAGAHAVQLDSVAWVEPGVVMELAAAWAAES